ncbi:MAG: FG-GAP-like repeat-containing protein [Candidatus Paceibacterota bacterium]
MAMITINSNIASLGAQRRLSASTTSLQSSFTRLSSGLRINKAADDAAGSSIAESLKTDQRVFNQGIRNLNDGVSLLSIADGALAELSNIAIRLSELAEQSANGALSNVQREALDEEGQALKAEYFRIAQTTEFNGQKLFDGKFGDLRLQAGYGEGGGIVSGLGGMIGDGTFQAATAYGMNDTPISVTAGDMNGDGILDIIGVNYNSNNVSVMFGNGDGSFQGQVTYSTGDRPLSVKVADFNGNGTLDIVTADRFSDSVGVMIGNGDGTFQARTAYDTGVGGPFDVNTEDFNNDGILDIVTADVLSNTVSVLLGNGDGSFHSRTAYNTGTQPRSVSVGDFNGDGIADLVTADFNSNVISVMLGNGDGSFHSRTAYNTGTQPRSVSVGDFNGDGIADLVTADGGSDTISVLLGNGDGSFQARTSYATGGGPISVETGDFNGDGIVDLVTADSDTDAVSIRLGRGDGSFQEQVTYSTGDSPWFVTTADFNGDGVSDLATADVNSNTASVLLGSTTDGVAPLLDFSLKTQAGARQTLPVFKRKLDQLSSQRGQIGAFEARVSSAIATTSIASANFASAESQIRDVDVAEESAQLVRSQILQQVGASILAQANQLPALALRLLSN